MTTQLGLRIRTERERNGWQQQELAFMARVKSNWLQAVESGNVKSPGAVSLQRVADALGVSVRYLVTGDGEPEGRAASDAHWYAGLPESVRQQMRRIANILLDAPLTSTPNPPRQPERGGKASGEEPGDERESIGT